MPPSSAFPPTQLQSRAWPSPLCFLHAAPFGPNKFQPWALSLMLRRGRTFGPVPRPRVPGAPHPILNRFCCCVETSGHKPAKKGPQCVQLLPLALPQPGTTGLTPNTFSRSPLEPCLIYNHVLHASLIILWKVKVYFQTKGWSISYSCPWIQAKWHSLCV